MGNLFGKKIDAILGWRLKAQEKIIVLLGLLLGILASITNAELFA